MRSATVLKPEKSPSTEMMCGTSSLAKPAQAVAQNTKLCSFDIAFTLPALTSSALAEQAVAVQRRAAPSAATAGSSAERGMLQKNFAVVVPMRRGRPRLSNEKLPPGAQPFVR